MLTIHVKGQVMEAICCETLVADSINMLEVQFVFSNEWAGMKKTAQFTQENEETKETHTYNVLLDEIDRAEVPNEITAGVVKISVFGVLGAQRATTAPLALPVKESGFMGDGETPIPPTPDLYQQFVERVNTVAETAAQEAAEKAVEDVMKNPPPIIMDVLELPATEYRDGVFYRVRKGVFVYNGNRQTDSICYVVNALPNTGEPVADNAGLNPVTAYYNTTDGGLYGYVPAQMAGAFGLVGGGWYSIAMLFNRAGLKYGGTVTDIEAASIRDVIYLLLESGVYYYDYEWKQVQNANDLNAITGDLSNLETKDKSSLVAAINEAAKSGGSGGGGIDVEPVPDSEVIDLMAENDLMLAVMDESGILADEEGNILEW